MELQDHDLYVAGVLGVYADAKVDWDIVILAHGSGVGLASFRSFNAEIDRRYLTAGTSNAAGAVHRPRHVR